MNDVEGQKKFSVNLFHARCGDFASVLSHKHFAFYTSCEECFSFL